MKSRISYRVHRCSTWLIRRGRLCPFGAYRVSISGQILQFFQTPLSFFTFLPGSNGRGAPKSSAGVLRAPQVCMTTPRTGVPTQASNRVPASTISSGRTTPSVTMPGYTREICRQSLCHVERRKMLDLKMKTNIHHFQWC